MVLLLVLGFVRPAKRLLVCQVICVEIHFGISFSATKFECTTYTHSSGEVKFTVSHYLCHNENAHIVMDAVHKCQMVVIVVVCSQ